VKSELRLDNNVCDVEKGKGENMRNKHVQRTTHILANAKEREGQVKTSKEENDWDVRSGECRDIQVRHIKRKRTNEGHSPTGESRIDKLTVKETARAKGTRLLESAEGGTSQENERERAWHSLSGEGWRDGSGQRKKASEGHSQSGEREGREKSEQ
jgi:hypothetical protein